MIDPFGDVDDQEPEIRRPGKKAKKFKAAATLQRRDVQQATGDTAGMHGQYKQANFKLRPEVLDAIDAWAEKLGVNKSQLKRYLAWKGLQALEAGERPEYQQSVTRDLVDY